MKKLNHGLCAENVDSLSDPIAVRKFPNYLQGLAALLLLSIACSATTEIAPTFMPPTATPFPTETPLPSPTATPIPNPTDLTANMAPPTPTPGPIEEIAPGAGCIPNNEQKSLVVTDVLSGDTIVVEIDQNNVELLYIGLAAPDPATKAGRDSADQNADWVEGMTITVIHDADPINGYGQLEAYVIAGDIFVNYEMAHQGYAHAVISKTNPSCNETFRQAEEEARREQAGLWSEPTPNPTAPLPNETPSP